MLIEICKVLLKDYRWNLDRRPVLSCPGFGGRSSSTPVTYSFTSSWSFISLGRIISVTPAQVATEEINQQAPIVQACRRGLSVHNACEMRCYMLWHGTWVCDVHVFAFRYTLFSHWYIDDVRNVITFDEGKGAY